MTICHFCGNPEQAEIFEMWSSHEFMLATCCEDLHDAVAQNLAADPHWAKSFLQSLGVEEISGYHLRRLADDGCCGLILD